jgi:hypothetical protein
MTARGDLFDDEDGPVERYTPSPERLAAAREANRRAIRLVIVVTAVTAVTGLVAAVCIGLST